MGKFSFLTIAFSLLCFSSQQCEATFAAEFRAAAFFPTASRFSNIYGDVNPSYQVEVSQTFCDCYQFWLNVDEFNQSGTLRECGRSHLNILTVSLGPKYLYQISQCFDLYGGLGLAVAWSRVNNVSIGKEYDTSVGLAVKSGINYYFSNRFFLDLFCDYNYQPAFHNETDIGGVKTGLGIGYLF